MLTGAVQYYNPRACERESYELWGRSDSALSANRRLRHVTAEWQGLYVVSLNMDLFAV